jgi:hypothetical protein
VTARHGMCVLMTKPAISRRATAVFAILLPLYALTGCSSADRALPQAAAPASAAPRAALVNAAEAFVPLTLEAGTYEKDYVDAYYGPPALRAKAEAAPRPRAILEEAARTMVASLDRDIIPNLTNPDDQRRARALRGFYQAAATRLAMIGGRKFSFEDEAEGLFSLRPQLKPLAHFDAILASLEKEVPGEGSLAARIDAFNERFVIPKDKLKPVFDAAIAACRAQTMKYMALPAGERFRMSFVTGKPWSGYNYYQGNYESVIEINTDLPIRISRAVDLGCHEGYPGHHVLNLMIEQKLVKGRGWSEYAVNPLYAPMSVISEGSANYGIDLAFPGAQRLVFERDVLYPLAGLDPASAEAFWRVQQATEGLSGARLTIARMYLDGEIDRAKALELTQKYLLLSPARAAQSIGFTDHYRSYVINYGLGKDMVRAYIESGAANESTRWQRMEQLLSEPTQPTDLLAR